MTNSVAIVDSLVTPSDEAAFVANLWDKWEKQRKGWLELKREYFQYVFATDTTHSDVGKEGWQHSTTIPKLCQIRDNLAANYMSGLFPHDNWLTWRAYTADSAKKKKARTIKAYMENKLREANFRTEIGKVINDYIDFGVCYAYADFEANYKKDMFGQEIPQFIGPVATRISPYDINFDLTARSFEEAPKIVRSVKNLGDIAKMAKTSPDQAFWQDVLNRRLEIRRGLGGIKAEDFNKQYAYQIAGFGSLHEYYGSDTIEILEFWGDYYNSETGELKEGQVMTIVDRSFVARAEDIPSWMGTAPIVSCVWRERPDNLLGMAVGDNLIGLQYKLDHLENMKADAIDMSVMPPLASRGVVEEFTWGPNEVIDLGEDGQITELGKNLNGVYSASAEMQMIEDRMELYAGAPREAMGFRTPGEKTLGEYQGLTNAANKIFQEKITNFELNFLEKLLNLMLETATRNLDVTDTISFKDTEKKFEKFEEITKADITARGVLRPVGARHFSKQSQDFQNVMTVFNSALGQMVAPHTSTIELSRFVEDSINLQGYDIFEKNVAIVEQMEQQGEMAAAQEEFEMEQSAPGIDETEMLNQAEQSVIGGLR